MKPAERNPADDTPATDPTPTPEPTRDDTPTPTPTPEPTPTPALPAGEAERAFAYAAAMRDGAAQRATQWVDGFLRDADSARRDKARDDIETAIRDTAGRLAAARESERQPEVDALSVRIGKIIHAAQTGNRPPPRATDAPTTRDTGEPGMRSLLVRQAEFEREAGADAPPMSAGTAIVALAGGAGSLTQKESASVLARHRELTDDILGRCTDSVREHIAPLLGGPMSPRGIMLLPSDFVRYGLERQRRIDKQMGRAQTAAAADNKGDSLVSTDVLVDEYIEGLYASSKLYEAGATVMAGLTSLKQIPVQSSNLDADFYAETGKIPNVDFGIGHVTLEPHRIGIANPSTLLIQILSGGAIGRWQMYNVMAALDNGQEGAFLNGNGAGNNPRGLRNTNGIDVVAIGTNGGNITVAKLAEPMTEIKKDNIFPDGKFTALLTPDTLTYGQSRARFGTGGDNFIIPEDLMRARYRILESNLLPTNLTKGTGTNLHAAAFGNFGDFFIATFGMPTVTFDDLTMIDSGQTRIVVNTFVDCVLARKESIKLMNDISVA